MDWKQKLNCCDCYLLTTSCSTAFFDFFLFLTTNGSNGKGIETEKRQIMKLLLVNHVLLNPNRFCLDHIKLVVRKTTESKARNNFVCFLLGLVLLMFLMSNISSCNRHFMKFTIFFFIHSCCLREVLYVDFFTIGAS